MSEMPLSISLIFCSLYKVCLNATLLLKQTWKEISYTSSIQAMLLLMVYCNIQRLLKIDFKISLCTSILQRIFTLLCQGLVVITIIKRDSKGRYCEPRIRKAGDLTICIRPIITCTFIFCCCHKALYPWWLSKNWR